MTEKHYCIICGKETQSNDPDVVFCPDHGGPGQGPSPVLQSQWKKGNVILDNYVVRGKLGEGGFGQVYLVHHMGWNLDLAVKKPRADKFKTEREKSNFIKEAETWVDLGLHPHITSCYYVRLIDDMPHVFVEFVEGGSLGSWIRGNKGNLYVGNPQAVLGRILDIAIQFAWGLGYAHNQNLIHRDVKPDNALMTLDGRLKVTDFGLARGKESVLGGGKQDAQIKIEVSGIAYSPYHCSPEQVVGKVLSLKTDIWSWAVSVLEMFNGRITWAGGQIADSALETYLRHGGESNIPPMPASLVEILRDCLQRDPENRHRDILTVAAQLVRIFLDETGQNYPRKMPKHAELHSDNLNNKAVSMLDLGRNSDAAANWQASITNDPHHLETVFNYGYWQWQNGRQTDQKFLEQINSVRAFHPEHANLDWFSGLVHAEIGHLDNAIPHLKKSWQRNEWQAGLLLVDCLKSKGELREARKILEKLWSDHRSSVSRKLDAGGEDAIWSQISSNRLPWRRCDLKLGGKAFENRYGLLSITPDGRYALVCVASAPILFDLVEKRQITTLKKGYGLTTSIVGLGLCRDGKRAATLVDDKTILLWDAFTGKVVKKIKGLPEYPGVNAFSHDLKLLVYLDALHQLNLWDLEKGDCVLKLQIPVDLPERGHMMTRLLAMDADARFCLLIMRDELFGIELPQGHLQFRHKILKDFVRHVTLTPDGSFALMGGDKGQIWLWNLHEMSHQALDGIEHHITDLAITPDARYGVSCSRGEYLTKDNTLRLWDLNEKRCIWTSPQQDEDIYAVAISEDAKYVYSYGDYGPLRRFKVDAGLEKNASEYSPLPHAFATPLSGSQAVEVFEQSQNLKDRAFELEKAGNWQKAYQLLRQMQQESLDPWDDSTLASLFRVGEHGRRSGLRAAALRKQLSGHSRRVFCLAHRPGQLEVLSGGDDYQVRRWNLNSGEYSSVINCDKTSIKSIAVDPRGQYAIIGGGGMNIYGDYLIRVLDLIQNRVVSKVNLSNHMTHDLCFGYDENIAAAVSDRFLFIFNPLDGSLYHRLKGHAIHVGGKRDSAGTPICTAFFPDGRHVLSGGDDQTICMWDLNTGKRIRRFQAPRGHVEKVLIMPGGAQILSGHSDHYLRVWKVDIEKPVLEIDTGGRIEGFTLTSDGRYVFSCGEDNTIKLWDLQTKEQCGLLEGHTNMVSDLTLVNEERWLVSASWDGTLGIWNLDWEFSF